jgi:hypothetical protein
LAGFAVRAFGHIASVSLFVVKQTARRDINSRVDVCFSSLLDVPGSMRARAEILQKIILGQQTVPAISQFSESAAKQNEKLSRLQQSYLFRKQLLPLLWNRPEKTKVAAALQHIMSGQGRALFPGHKECIKK